MTDRNDFHDVTVKEASNTGQSVLPLAALPSARFGLIMRALWLLAKFDWIAKTRGFPGIYRRIAGCEVSTRIESGEDSIGEVCAAVSRACGYYPKTAACLQRSAAAAWMLRKRGVPAELIIGVKKFPFQSHAWVEVAGRVVNDRQRVRELYLTLDRCGAAQASSAARGDACNQVIPSQR